MDNARALERIEQAEREARLCTCGRTPLAVGRPDGVWLECPSLGQARSTISRILTFDFAAGHTRWRIIDPVDLDPRTRSGRLSPISRLDQSLRRIDREFRADAPRN